MGRNKDWWLDAEEAYYRWHGEWADPEIEFMGYALNYWTVDEALSAAYGEDYAQHACGRDVEVILADLVFAEYGADLTALLNA